MELLDPRRHNLDPILQPESSHFELGMKRHHAISHKVVIEFTSVDGSPVALAQNSCLVLRDDHISFKLDFHRQLVILNPNLTIRARDGFAFPAIEIPHDHGLICFQLNRSDLGRTADDCDSSLAYIGDHAFYRPSKLCVISRPFSLRANKLTALAGRRDR